MASKTYNVGVIGYGFSAKIFHIPFISVVPELKLYAIVQRTPKPDDDAEKDYPGIKSYRSTEDMVNDAAVDLVVVTTTPDTHLPLAKTALNAGKHGMYIYTAFLILCNKYMYMYVPTTNTGKCFLSKFSRCRKAIYSNISGGR